MRDSSLCFGETVSPFLCSKTLYHKGIPFYIPVFLLLLINESVI